MKRTLIVASGLAVAALGACSDSSSPNPSTDITAVQPAGGATGVDPAAPIVLTFSGPMMAGMEQFVDLHMGQLSDPTVPMTCAWSPDHTQLTCTPNQPLQAGTQYRLHLGGGMMDQHQEHIGWDHAMTQFHGQWITSGMMGGAHAGMPWNMMGDGWRHGMSDYGMEFVFTTT